MSQRLAISVLAVLISATACASAFEGDGQFLELQGGQVHLWCDGDQQPAVVFLAAIGGDDTLVPIAEELADEATTCFYFRPGDGDTDPPAEPRTAAADAADLHELLATADIAVPAVLVAHSYGGLVAVIAAAEHPDDIAGVVLVDGSQPDAESRMYLVMTDAQRAHFDGEMANFPHVDWPTSLGQTGDSVPDFPDIPLTVITATRSFLDPCQEELPCEELQAIWIEAQEAYAAMTPDAVHVLAETSHYVHNDDPDLVLSEIRGLLGRLD